jgi:glycosyltransferase involved in cell wall biosynthesis
VGSDDAVIPELIDRPEIGRVHPTDDEAALAQALLEAIAMARDDGTATACRARAEEFSTDRATEGYEAVYAEVLRSRTRQY